MYAYNVYLVFARKLRERSERENATWMYVLA